MARRAHQHELVRAIARCDRCTFTADGNNAQALAARHHDAKGHRVTVDITTRITYGALLGKTRDDEKQGKML